MANKVMDGGWPEEFYGYSYRKEPVETDYIVNDLFRDYKFFTKILGHYGISTLREVSELFDKDPDLTQLRNVGKNRAEKIRKAYLEGTSKWMETYENMRNERESGEKLVNVESSDDRIVITIEIPLSRLVK
jgi:hypothetical protein